MNHLLICLRNAVLYNLLPTLTLHFSSLSSWRFKHWKWMKVMCPLLRAYHWPLGPCAEQIAIDFNIFALGRPYCLINDAFEKNPTPPSRASCPPNLAFAFPWFAWKTMRAFGPFQNESLLWCIHLQQTIVMQTKKRASCSGVALSR